MADQDAGDVAVVTEPEQKDDDAQSSGSDEEMPQLQPKAEGEAAEGDDSKDTKDGKARQNRAEKKSRRALTKLGLVPLPGKITRVNIKKSKNITFVITNPEVFKSPSTDTYVIHGEVHVDDNSERMKQDAQQLLGQFGQTLSKAKAANAKGDGQVDVDQLEGLSKDDVKTVMDHVGCDTATAVKALKNAGGDILEAILPSG